jgi:hypothetical protein
VEGHPEDGHLWMHPFEGVHNVVLRVDFIDELGLEPRPPSCKTGVLPLHHPSHPFLTQSSLVFMWWDRTTHNLSRWTRFDATMPWMNGEQPSSPPHPPPAVV